MKLDSTLKERIDSYFANISSDELNATLTKYRVLQDSDHTDKSVSETPVYHGVYDKFNERDCSCVSDLSVDYVKVEMNDTFDNQDKDSTLPFAT